MDAMKAFFTELLRSIGFSKLALVFLVWNVIVFFLYGTDKLKAKKGEYNYVCY